MSSEFPSRPSVSSTDQTQSIPDQSPDGPATTGYRGYRRNRRSYVVRVPEETFLRAGPSRSLAAHSRGFEWGYAGSGPAQLSLALLYDHYDDPTLALDCYQQFTLQVVSELEGRWRLTTDEIETAVAAIRGTSHGQPL